MRTEPPVAVSIRALADRLGTDRFVEVCSDLLEGAPRERYVAELRGLTRLDRLPDPRSWHDYWLRTWGARGLLHVWDDRATPAVRHGLGDEHWRPVEMCLKVVAAHDVAGAGDRAAALTAHERPRVRAQALRALAVVGDTEHVAAVRDRLADPDEAVRRQAARALAALERRLDLA
ncbi:HEAT repeat domain-containing protein [Nocardioides anomalus]|uniref:HEAT repeat domain-containing protein n=1 Tax=Nocardioides anomalus TaxID=2712223 RepID=A0A6G6WG17_9ACTN|nr:HEAT repeat domain-containing protein [Nocardioides anomalus]QIG44103.1 HEAT repeat domain-containing protein [Nocardioides anomalus]